MKTMKWNLYSMALLAGLSFFTACSDDDNNGNGDDKGDVTVLKNMTISSELVSKQNIYTNANFVAGENNKVDAGLKYASFDAVKAECDWMKGNWVR